MKKYVFPPLAAFLVVLQPVMASEPELQEPGQQSLSHAFDTGWKGEETCKVLFEDQAVRVGRCIFPPGSGHEKHYHHPHFGYVLEGGMLLIQDDRGERKVTTESGSTWSTTSNTVHQAQNIGDTTTSYLIVEPKAPPLTTDQ
jgi:quercetin dioxygenase-like cupin family protein